ncbi:MAG: type II secretion system F family protein [Parcubacteria group bacterium]|nr:type II secretion system F family protein [Parcubacteria group bacterium]
MKTIINNDRSLNISPFLHISEREKMFFARYLSILLRSGIPLLKSVESIRKNTRSKHFQKILDIVLVDLNSGLFLATSLDRFRKIFSRSFVSIVKVGEESGQLAESLNKLSIQMQKNEELRAKVVTAFIYPMILIVASLSVAGYLVAFVIPNLLPVFTSLNVALPFTTRTVIWVSDFFITKYWLVFLIIFSIIVTLRFLFMIEKFAYSVDALLLKTPLIGNILKNAQLAFFSRILSIMITSGVNIVDAIATTSNALSNRVYKKRLHDMGLSLNKGQYIYSALADQPDLFPSMVLQMIEVGEKTGKLPDTLLFVSDFSEEEAERSISRLSIFVEPVILLFMGFLVGFIAIAVVTPIYQLTTGIR